MILEIIIALLSLVIVWLYLRPRRVGFVLAKEVEDEVADVLASVDDPDLGDEEEPGVFFIAGRRKPFLARVISAAKAEFGLLQRTEANRLMVRKYMRDMMRERGMRPTHVAQHLDYAVALFFVPTKTDVLAHQVEATRIASVRMQEATGVWESFYGVLDRMKGFSKG